jgi:hypothetical protein
VNQNALAFSRPWDHANIQSPAAAAVDRDMGHPVSEILQKLLVLMGSRFDVFPGKNAVITWAETSD